MKDMNLKAIAAACGGVYHGDEKAAFSEISSVVIDSRKAEKGSLFIAITGARNDGHDYIHQVYEKGALCCITEKELTGEVHPYIRVQSSLQALKDIAAYYRRCLSVKVVGITGSVGKTSTKETVAAMLSQKYKVLKTRGNFNNEIGLPLTIFEITPEDEIAVLEMGISDFGEMSRLAAIAKPDICVITNIGCCHLENLQSRDGVLRAKTEIFEQMNPEGCVILNGDDDKLSAVQEVWGKSPIFFGMGEGMDFWANQVENKGLEGLQCSLHWENEKPLAVDIPVPGSHMIYNALAGAAVGVQLGLRPEDIQAGLKGLKTLAGRNHIIKTEYFTLIDDCYNANPVSMRASIDVLDHAIGRRVCILGDMFELGREEEALHREVGRYIAGKGIHLVITIGHLSRHILEGIRQENAPIETVHFPDKESFLQERSQWLSKGDNILIKASHGMDFAWLVSALSNEEIAHKEI